MVDGLECGCYRADMDNGILLRLSDSRQAQLHDDPGLMQDIIEARFETEIPGLLDLGPTWDCLDLLLSGRGTDDAILGDAVVARTGAPLRAILGSGPPRILPPARVAEVSKALAQLPDTFIEAGYPGLNGQENQGDFGQEVCADDDAASIKQKVQDQRRAEVETLQGAFEQLRSLYREASDQGHAVLSVVV